MKPEQKVRRRTWKATAKQAIATAKRVAVERDALKAISSNALLKLNKLKAANTELLGALEDSQSLLKWLVPIDENSEGLLDKQIEDNKATISKATK